MPSGQFITDVSIYALYNKFWDLLASKVYTPKELYEKLKQEGSLELRIKDERAPLGEAFVQLTFEQNCHGQWVFSRFDSRAREVVKVSVESDKLSVDYIQRRIERYLSALQSSVEDVNYGVYQHKWRGDHLANLKSYLRGEGLIQDHGQAILVRDVFLGDELSDIEVEFGGPDREEKLDAYLKGVYVNTKTPIEEAGWWSKLGKLALVYLAVSGPVLTPWLERNIKLTSAGTVDTSLSTTSDNLETSNLADMSATSWFSTSYQVLNDAVSTLNEFFIDAACREVSLVTTYFQNSLSVFSVGSALASPKHREVGVLMAGLFYTSLLPSAVADCLDGLIAYYPFNGDTADESGNGHDAINSGASLASDRYGNSNQAYSFDGTNDYMVIPYSTDFDFSDGITVAAWVQADSTTGNNGIVAQWDDSAGEHSFYSKIRNSNFRFELRNTEGSVITELDGSSASSEWTLFVSTYDLNQAAIYLNGNIDVTDSSSDIIDSPPMTDITIGCNILSSGSYSEFFDGRLDDIYIFNRSLSAGEIEKMYSTGSIECTQSPTPVPTTSFSPTPYPTLAPTLAPTKECDLEKNLIAYYTFDGNSKDVSGNGNHASNNGATLTTDRNGNSGQAYSFDGTSDYMRVPYNTIFNFDGGLTVAAWIQADTTSGERGIIGQWDDSTKERTFYTKITSGSYRYELRNDDSSWIADVYPDSSPTTQWVFIVNTYNNTYASYFLNGLLDKFELTSGEHIPTEQNDILIGSNINSLGEYAEHFDGKVDEVSIFNRSLTSSEVFKLYNSMLYNSLCLDAVAVVVGDDDNSSDGNGGLSYGVLIAIVLSSTLGGGALFYMLFQLCKENKSINSMDGSVESEVDTMQPVDRRIQGLLNDITRERQGLNVLKQRRGQKREEVRRLERELSKLRSRSDDRTFRNAFVSGATEEDRQEVAGQLAEHLPSFP